MQANEVVDEIFRQINGPRSSFSKQLVTTFLDEHPALQQEFFNTVILPVIEALAKEKRVGAIDPRNRNAYDTAVKFWKSM